MPDLEMSGAAAITALIPILVPFVVWGAKSLLPKIPRAMLPIVAVGAGMALDALNGYITGGEWAPLLGAALGALGVFAREFVHTLREHGLDS